MGTVTRIILLMYLWREVKVKFLMWSLCMFSQAMRVTGPSPIDRSWGLLSASAACVGWRSSELPGLPASRDFSDGRRWPRRDFSLLERSSCVVPAEGDMRRHIIISFGNWLGSRLLLASGELEDLHIQTTSLSLSARLILFTTHKSEILESEFWGSAFSLEKV